MSKYLNLRKRIFFWNPCMHPQGMHPDICPSSLMVRTLMRKMMVTWAFYLLHWSHFNTYSLPVNTLGTLYMLITSWRQNNRQNDRSFSVKDAEEQKLEAVINLSPKNTQNRYLIPTHLTWLYISCCLLGGKKNQHASVGSLLTSKSLWD